MCLTFHHSSCSVFWAIFPLHCRTRQSKLTSQTRVLRHQLPSDLPAVAHKQIHNGRNHWLVDIIYFPLGCYRKNLKKTLMIYWWLYSCLLPFFEATTSCCWRSYCYCWELLHSGFGSVGKTSPLPTVCNEWNPCRWVCILSINAWNNVSLWCELLCAFFCCRSIRCLLYLERLYPQKVWIFDFFKKRKRNWK